MYRVRPVDVLRLWPLFMLVMFSVVSWRMLLVLKNPAMMTNPVMGCFVVLYVVRTCVWIVTRPRVNLVAWGLPTLILV